MTDWQRIGWQLKLRLGQREIPEVLWGGRLARPPTNVLIVYKCLKKDCGLFKKAFVKETCSSSS